MGEPLHNMSALMPALDIICHPQGLALSKAKVIVSTVGLVPQLRQLRASGKAKLAVSLHATTDEVRSWIVPTNRKYPLDDLIGALRELYPLPDSAKRSSSSSSSSEPESSSCSSSEALQQEQQQQKQSSRSDDFVVIEYVLLKDVNDTGALMIEGVAVPGMMSSWVLVQLHHRSDEDM
jgi:23S rRNA (adenine2503-C2)-methyltransferase